MVRYRINSVNIRKNLVLAFYLTSSRIGALTDTQTHGQMDRWTHRHRKDGKMDRWTHRDRWADGYTDTGTDGQMDTQINGQMDRWTIL